MKVGHTGLTDCPSQKMGGPWRGAFETWMKAFLAGRQAAITGYHAQTLHQLEITLNDMAARETDPAEKSALQQTRREMSAQLPPTAFQFHSAYPH